MSLLQPQKHMRNIRERERDEREGRVASVCAKQQENEAPANLSSAFSFPP